MALLRGTSEADYEVRWVFDPLNEFQFADLHRTVSWTWKVHPGEGGLNANWHPSDPPPLLPANGFKAVITITLAFRAQLPLGLAALQQRINAA